MICAARLILQAEGAAIFAAATLAYAHFDGHRLTFAPLFVTPDLFMLSYLSGPRLGAGPLEPPAISPLCGWPCVQRPSRAAG